MRLILTAAALLIAAAPAPAPQKKDAVPVATPDGKPVSCIIGRQIRQTYVRSDNVIDFEMRGGQVYRNELPGGCPGLASEKRFLHKSSIDEYCSVDTITVLHSPPMIEGATCGLGEFQPVKLVKPAK
ncbi:hypothetical protein [Sphingomonas sp.]|uniref:hypothetical protein n=1 Tax=Sphingomonas sp. TaxID=28214 RepID=UPI001B183463|nr:hypothetical protein [Sphingomonas sp.]MBO9712391.1 hypothetical protein [Sphingomonas sp.]